MKEMLFHWVSDTTFLLRRYLVYMQNSGLGNAIDPITDLMSKNTICLTFDNWMERKTGNL